VVLDVGCGTGANFSLLEQALGKNGRLIGLDQSPEMLTRARALVRSAGWQNVELVEAPVDKAPIPLEADAALFCLTHDILRSPPALENVFRHLKPGGRFVAAGLKFAPWWNVPLNAVALVSSWQYVTTWEGYGRPWSHLPRFDPDLRVETFWFGRRYLAWGRRCGVELSGV